MSRLICKIAWSKRDVILIKIIGYENHVYVMNSVIYIRNI